MNVVLLIDYMLCVLCLRRDFFGKVRLQNSDLSLSFQQDHLEVCPYFEVPCPLGKCKEKMMRKDMSEHLSRKCKHREITCEFCSHKMALTELQVTRITQNTPVPIKRT